jgi:hypothetical protein
MKKKESIIDKYNKRSNYILEKTPDREKIISIANAIDEHIGSKITTTIQEISPGIISIPHPMWLLVSAMNTVHHEINIDIDTTFVPFDKIKIFLYKVDDKRYINLSLHLIQFRLFQYTFPYDFTNDDISILLNIIKAYYEAGKLVKESHMIVIK